MNIFNMTSQFFLRNTKKHFIATLIFLIANFLYSQETQINYNIDMFPKTPDAAALSKFVDIPAGSYTGVANFSIPIYVIEFDGGKLPIELQYTTNGIKVGEIASRTGLGWVLNAGPSLSQQVIGSYDNYYKKPIISSTTNFPDNCPMSDYSLNDPCGIALHGAGLKFPNRDLNHDVFSYSLLNSSGQFIMDSNMDFGITRPYSQTKIIPQKASSGYFTGIELTDEIGNLFQFNIGGFNEVTNFSSCNPGNEDLGAPIFRISTIKSPKNKEISFFYNKTTKSRYITSIAEQKLIDHQIMGIGGSYSGIAQRCINYTISNEAVLTQINFPEGKIHFYYNNDPEGFIESKRQDLFYDETQGDVYLTRVIVKNNLNQTVKDISLKYEYFDSNDLIPSYITTHYPNYAGGLNKRLKLKEVQDNFSLETYNLLYYESYKDKKLPNRVSNSQDYWGVFNGKNNSTTSIATIKSPNYSSSVEKIYFGADKNPDINYGKIGNLKKIEYPTGGYTEIFYEADDYLKAGNIPPIYDYEAYPTGDMPLIFTAGDLDPVIFEIPTNSFNQKLTFGGVGGCGWRLDKWNGNDFQNYSYGFASSDNRNELSGRYRLRIVHGDNGPNSNCYAEYNWFNEVVVNDSLLRKTGNIRIRKIDYNSGDNGKITREYSYKYPNDYQDYTLRNQSSGKNLGEEMFYPLSTKIKPMGAQDPWGTLGYVKELIMSNNPGWQTNTVRGKPVGYDYVQEIYTSTKNPGENYIKEYNFKNDDFDDWVQHNPYRFYNFSFPKITGLDRGILLNERLYNKNHDLVKKTEYKYINDPYFNRSPFSNMSPSSYTTKDFVMQMEIVLTQINKSPLQNKSYDFIGAYYPIENYWIKNTSVTTTDYDSNENPTIEVTENMEYSSEYKHTFLSKKITENSLGEILKTEYSYPQDGLHWQTGIMNQMIQKNMVSTPVIVKTYNNETLLSEQMTEYQVVNTDQILSHHVYAKKGSNNLEKKITYNSYDARGNLTQYTMENGTPVSIIWGYNGQYPIAKVEGKTYTEITTLAQALITDSNSTYGLEPAFFDNLRNLTGAIVTCYIYKPLVGVTTIIQPNGQKETYEYDGSGRLMQVKDHNGSILKKMDYHYKN